MNAASDTLDPTEQPRDKHGLEWQDIEHGHYRCRCGVVLSTYEEYENHAGLRGPRTPQVHKPGDRHRSRGWLRSRVREVRDAIIADASADGHRLRRVHLVRASYHGDGLVVLFDCECDGRPCHVAVAVGQMPGGRGARYSIAGPGLPERLDAPADEWYAYVAEVAGWGPRCV